MTFEATLKLVKCGVRAKRSKWISKKIALNKHDDYLEPFLYMEGPGGKITPWTPSQNDLLAEDWEILPMI